MLIHSNPKTAVSQCRIIGRLINMNKNSLKIGFIGCGKMASAIIKGILKSGISPQNVIASEITLELAEKQSKELGIKVYADNKSVAKYSDVIFLAVKPHFIKDVLDEIMPDLSSGKLIVSIAAGISTSAIEEKIGSKPRVIRVMPNTPAVVLEGMSGICAGKFATDNDVEFIVSLLSGIGQCVVLNEDKIDILTAISGSGPAFFYKIFDEIALAGEKMGLDYKTSLALAIQAAIGSAKLMQQSDLSASELIASVATKGGCTAVGVDYLESINSKEIFYELIKATAQKAKELG